MDRPPRRLSRIALLIWLLMPLVIVALLWFSIDRSQGRADPERWRQVPAGPGSASDRVPAAAPSESPLHNPN